MIPVKSVRQFAEQQRANAPASFSAYHLLQRRGFVNSNAPRNCSIHECHDRGRICVRYASLSCHFVTLIRLSLILSLQYKITGCLRFSNYTYVGTTRTTVDIQVFTCSKPSKPQDVALHIDAVTHNLQAYTAVTTLVPSTLRQYNPAWRVVQH